MMKPSTILVTGCVQGIGRALVEQLAERGASLALLDIDSAGLTRLGADISAQWPKLKYALCHADIVDRASVDAAIAMAIAALGPLDVVVCNAGGITSLVEEKKLSATFTSFAESKPEDWRKIVDLNLMGPMNVAHAALPGMLERSAGRIVLVSSESGIMGSVGLSIYSAAKGGVIALTKALSRELAQSGISVNSVAPGGVGTRVFPKGSERRESRASRIPMGRVAEPHEIANVIAYLALDAPDYLNGEIIAVTGGPL